MNAVDVLRTDLAQGWGMPDSAFKALDRLARLVEAAKKVRTTQAAWYASSDTSGPTWEAMHQARLELNDALAAVLGEGE